VAVSTFFNQSARECNITKVEAYAVLPSATTGSTGTLSSNVTIDSQGNLVLNTTAPLHHQAFPVFLLAKANNGTSHVTVYMTITTDCSTQNITLNSTSNSPLAFTLQPGQTLVSIVEGFFLLTDRPNCPANYSLRNDDATFSAYTAQQFVLSGANLSVSPNLPLPGSYTLVVQGVISPNKVANQKVTITVPCNDAVIVNSTALKQFSNAENAGQVTIASANSFFNQSARECNITKIEVFAEMPSLTSNGIVSTNVTIDTQGNVVLNTTAPLHHQVFRVFIAAKAKNGTAFTALSLTITADCTTQNVTAANTSSASGAPMLISL